MTPSAKRNLSAGPLSDSRTTKRPRRSTTTHPSESLTAITSKGQSEYEKVAPPSDSKNHSSSNDSSPVSRPDVDGDSETTSSGSDLDDTSEDPSSNGDEAGTSSRHVIETPASAGDSFEEDDLVQKLPVLKIPPVSAINQSSDLRTRLSSFLPELQKANADLQKSSDVRACRLDEVSEDEEHYIEMNLGLGVLKENRPHSTQAGGIKTRDDHNTSSGEDSDSDIVDARVEPDDCKAEMTPLDDVMQSRRRSKKKPTIQVLLAG